MLTDDDKALVEAMKDAVLHGTGFMRGGKHIPIKDVYLDPRDAKIEAQAAEIERLLDYDEAKANALHNTLNQLANAEQEIERIKDRLGWICAVMDLDDEVTLQWIYTELQALRGAE